MDRRTFLSDVSQAACALTLARGVMQSASAAENVSPNEKVTVCVAGVGGRGASLLSTFVSLPGVEVKYVCDLDDGVLSKRVDETASVTGRRPEAIKDFRRALDDDQVTALVLGTPDHWHAIPTIMACQSGRDVYVEKPDGHNLLEGRTMVAAAKKYSRVVQLGTQSRSGMHLASAMEYLRAGHLGRVVFARAWESSRQSSLGHPADAPVPEGVDYDFWLGPAPKRPFNPLRFHGNWRWFFDYGTGDLGNDGVHRLDMARWALETAMAAHGDGPLGFPKKVSATGGKYYFDDDQEWPDTLLVSYDYSGRLLTYEMRVWSAYPFEGESEGAAVYGDQGYLVIGNQRWRAFDPKGEVVAQDSARYNDVGHAQNFIDCMRTRDKPTADLETIGHPSSVLCHLGNIAWRTGRTVQFNPETYTFLGDDNGLDHAANQYMTRAEYRPPWTLPAISQL